MDLSMSTWDIGDHTVVAVSGEVDVYTAPRLRQRVAELAKGGRHRLVVDLREVSFMDSTGLGVLVSCLRAVRQQNGSLSLVCTGERIVRLLRLTGLTKVFSCHADVESAVAADGG